MAADGEGHEDAGAHQSGRRLPPRRTESSASPRLVVGRNDKHQRHEQSDETESHQCADTEPRVEHSTPGVHVEQARPSGRLEIHALKCEVHDGRESENGEGGQDQRAQTTAIDERVHEESRSPEGDHHGEVRQPSHDHQRGVDPRRSGTTGENATDQLTHVDITGVGRSHREREGTSYEMSVARHHTPGDDMDAVVQRREAGQFHGRW